MMTRKRPFNKPAAKKSAPIRIDGEHAKVREITKKGHPLRGRIERTLGSLFTPRAKYNLSHTLAHLFFPRNFAEPVAVSTGIGGKAMEKTYSRKVRLDTASQKGIEAFYNRFKKPGLTGKYYAHQARVTGKANRLKFLKFTNAGIVVKTYPVNVGFRNSKPVFFEIGSINVKKAEQYARNELRGIKRKQALSIISELKRHIPEKEWDGFVGVHLT